MMNAADVSVLPTVTSALTDLRNAGITIGVEILRVSMTVNGKPVQYAWDPGSSEWQIAAQ